MSQDNASHSVTMWIGKLRGDEADHDRAAYEIWDRYADDLLRLAKSRLSERLRRRVDEEDVTQNAYSTFCRRFKEGQFTITNRNDLLALLINITIRKTRSAARKETADKCNMAREQGQSGNDDADNPLDLAPDSEPSPDDASVFLDEIKVRLDALDPAKLALDERFAYDKNNPEKLALYQEIARLKFQGMTNEDAAKELGTTERTVQRKLEIIAVIWHESGLAPEDVLPQKYRKRD